MRRGLLLLLPLLFACGAPHGLDLRVAGPHLAGGSGADAGLACGTLPFGPDCCESGRRVTSASCVQGQWSCETGAFCTCEGKPQTFQCAEYCGSDAFVAPDCVNGEWVCSRPTMPTSNCRADTCWGEPGDCCGGAACVDGGWTCAFTPSGCE